MRPWVPILAIFIAWPVMAASDQAPDNSAARVRVRRLLDVAPATSTPETPKRPRAASLPPPTLSGAPTYAEAAACRAQCAQSYYFCAASAQPQDCPPAFARCAAGCEAPEFSAGLAVAAP
jgi:hypothetical protein